MRAAAPPLGRPGQPARRLAGPEPGAGARARLRGAGAGAAGRTWGWGRRCGGFRRPARGPPRASEAPARGVSLRACVRRGAPVPSAGQGARAVASPCASPAAKGVCAALCPDAGATAEPAPETAVSGQVQPPPPDTAERPRPGRWQESQARAPHVPGSSRGQVGRRPGGQRRKLCVEFRP